MKFVWCVVALLLGGAGIFAVIDPEEMIYLRDFWRYRDSEPSEQYIRFVRRCGVGAILAAVVILIVTFVS